MKPCKLNQDFEFCHGELVGKPIDYFGRKSEHCRLDSEEMWAKSNKSALEALYHIIGQAKKPHTIGDELMKLCLFKATTRPGTGEGKADINCGCNKKKS